MNTMKSYSTIIILIIASGLLTILAGICRGLDLLCYGIVHFAEMLQELPAVGSGVLTSAGDGVRMIWCWIWDAYFDIERRVMA